MSRLGNILNAIVNPFGKTLWTGTWSSGSITVNGISKYSLFEITVTGDIPILAYSDGSRVRVLGVTGTSNQNFFSGYFDVSGNTCTYGAFARLVHNASGNHGTASTTWSVTKIVGLVPNWGS